MTINELRTKLLEYKDKNNLTTTALAAKTLIPYITLDNFLFKNAYPFSRTIRKLHQFFNLDPDAHDIYVTELKEQFKRYAIDNNASVSWLSRKTGLSFRAINAFLSNDCEVRGNTIIAIENFLSKKPKIGKKAQFLINAQKKSVHLTKGFQGEHMSSDDSRKWWEKRPLLMILLLIMAWTAWNLFFYMLLRKQ